MANNLERTIQPGEIVIVQRSLLRDDPQYDPPAARAFICRTGFGLHAFTVGSKIGGEWQDGSGSDTIRGEWIDAVETGVYERQHLTAGY